MSAKNGIIQQAAAKWSVEATVAGLPGPVLKTDTNSPVPFFHMLERLKTTPREGWRRKGIANGESIADHMYRMSIITMFAPPSLNVTHCTRMALIHDMAEALVGDITPVDGVPKEEKSRREATTMDFLTGRLLGNFNGGLNGEKLREIWQEYEDGKTPESQFVHDIDKLELVLQMLEYERANKGIKNLSEFTYVAEKIITPEVKAWCNEVLREREEYWKHLGGAPPLAQEDELAVAREEYHKID